MWIYSKPLFGYTGEGIIAGLMDYIIPFRHLSTASHCDIKGECFMRLTATLLAPAYVRPSGIMAT